MSVLGLQQSLQTCEPMAALAELETAGERDSNCRLGSEADLHTMTK